LIDAALIRMRRVIEFPSLRGDPVDLSAVLVVNAVARLHAASQLARIADIAANLMVQPSTASRLVASAESAGFIQRAPSPDDQRSVILVLTEAGEILDLTAKKFRIGFLQQASVDWDDHTVTVFAKLLDEFSRATAANASGRSSAHNR